MNKFYLTTAIAYVNGVPHVGHALEFIQADCLARYYRACGVDTRFLTGTDEHGVKIYETAKEAGEETQDFVDKNAAIFQSLEEILNLSNDDFVRTTEERHKAGAQKIWKMLEDAGDIYKDVYKGNYCVGCEAFIPEKDLVDGKCAIHGKEPKLLEEENYFFRLSKYSDLIKVAIESGELKVVPESRKKEMLNIIGDDGLHDVSFSRPKSALPWGVEVPGDDSQVMYVWCDALSNYITALGFAEDDELVAKYWPCDAHVIGKDILRFHAGIWIGMLMSAGIDVPKAIYVHGFVTSEGQKMSKSLGNVVDPLEYVEKYGVDAVRYYLMREIPTTDDGDFSHGRFLDVYNSELANGLGNLVNRVVMMTEKYAEGKAPAVFEDEHVSGELAKLVEAYKAGFESYDIKKACECLLRAIALGNKYIDNKKPWAMAKEGNDELAGVLYVMLETLRFITELAAPIIPETAEKIACQLGVEKLGMDLQWGGVQEGQSVVKGELLFKRLEEG